MLARGYQCFEQKFGNVGCFLSFYWFIITWPPRKPDLTVLNFLGLLLWRTYLSHMTWQYYKAQTPSITDIKFLVYCIIFNSDHVIVLNFFLLQLLYYFCGEGALLPRVHLLLRYFNTGLGIFSTILNVYIYICVCVCVCVCVCLCVCVWI